MKKLLLAVLLCGISFGCGEEALRKDITNLELELYHCQNGPDKILRKINFAMDSVNYRKVRGLYFGMKHDFPESPEFIEAQKIYNLAIELEDRNLDALKNLRSEPDDISGITWYYPKSFKHSLIKTLSSLYMGADENRTWVRLRMSYGGDNWIFFDKAYLSYDGNTMEVPFDQYGDKKTENSSGSVWEWIDISLPTGAPEFLETLAQSENAKMRLSGKYSVTRDLSQKEKDAMLEILQGYQALKAEKSI
jgi:hypothetical protein